MDYPFFLKHLHTLSPETLSILKGIADTAAPISHPHFASKSKNHEAYQLDKAITTPTISHVVRELQEQVPILRGVELYWHEVNALAQGGFLGEHSDLAHAGYNTSQGTPMEVLLTHKVHIHIDGSSELSFRRSNREAPTVFHPEPGQCFWYNNYVWHSSRNSGIGTRTALSLIFHDRRWIVRGKLFESLGLRFNDCYQTAEG